jgi:hypothetical protein
MKDKGKQIEMALRKYAYYYASSEKAAGSG